MHVYLMTVIFVFLLKQGKANQRIIDGQNPDGNISWVVYLCRNGSILRPLGTGAIISPYHVITSARNMLDNVTNEVLIDTMVTKEEEYFPRLILIYSIITGGCRCL